MISSKNFNVIAILLTALVTVGVVCAMLVPKSTITGKITGELSYSELHSVNLTDGDYYGTYAESSVAKITLKGDTAETKSRNVQIDGGSITILGGGVYVLQGTLNDGCIFVNSTDGAEVRLIFNGVNITSSDFSAIYVKQALKTVISLVEGTENSLTDGAMYNEGKLENGKPTAALYSKDDLVINGKGSLTVNGNYKDGIKANDTLKITESKLTVNAADKGINVNDSLALVEAEINVTSKGDAVRCEHENEAKGFIAFENARLCLTSEGDGISASSALYVNNTEAEITTGGGSENAESRRGGFWNTSKDSASTKAVKAGTNMLINGGSFILNSKDDSLHSNGDITIENGNFVISSGDDAVHADLNLVLNPESLKITKCYEGLEGAYVTVNGGEISIISDDDGINATGEGVNSGMQMMHKNQGEEKTSNEDIWLTLNGGHIYIEASGDGIDSNGSAVINGGLIEIYGPEDNGNGSIDVGDGGYVLIMNGGSLIAAGSSGMAEHPTESSPLNTLVFYLDETYSKNSTITLKTSNGEEIISGTSNKRFNWICVSTPSLTEGEAYTLYINENETANATVNNGVTQIGAKNGNGAPNQNGFHERKH